MPERPNVILAAVEFPLTAEPVIGVLDIPVFHGIIYTPPLQESCWCYFLSRRKNQFDIHRILGHVYFIHTQRRMVYFIS
jgi:hypothetical protein